MRDGDHVSERTSSKYFLHSQAVRAAQYSAAVAFEYLPVQPPQQELQWRNAAFGHHLGPPQVVEEQWISGERVVEKR